MRKSATLLKSLELKLQMVASLPLKLLRKSTSTKHVQLISLAKCSQPFLSYLCSNLKPSNFNRRRMIKRVSLKRPCTDSIKDCHQLKLLNQSGKRLRGNVREKKQIARIELKERCSSLNSQPLVSKQQLSPDLTLICLQISVSNNPFVTLNIEIPRPYGVFAPFMPSEPGSAMRHIIKPKIREIEY